MNHKSLIRFLLLFLASAQLLTFCPLGFTLDGDFSPDKALQEIYGAKVWRDSALKQYQEFSEHSTAYINQHFVATYQEDGLAKNVIIAVLTPTESYHFCSACKPLIGGAIFVKQNDQWVIDAVNRLIGVGEQAENMQLIKIGRDRYGVMLNKSLMRAAQFFNYELLYQSDNGDLLKFELPIVSGPGPGECEVLKQRYQYSFSSGHEFHIRRQENFHDLFIEMQWNEGRCDRVSHGDLGEESFFVGKICRKYARYRRVGDEYQHVVDHLDSCTEWKTVRSELQAK